MTPQSIVLFAAHEPLHGFTAVPVEGGETIYVRAEASERYYSVAIDDANPAAWETLLNTIPAKGQEEVPS